MTNHVNTKVYEARKTKNQKVLRRRRHDALEPADSVSILLSLIIIICCSNMALAQRHGVDVAWDPNSESDLAGYRTHIGTESGSYNHTVNVGNATEYFIFGLKAGVRYFAAVTAYNQSGSESDYSNEISFFFPLHYSFEGFWTNQEGNPVGSRIQLVNLEESLSVEEMSNVSGNIEVQASSDLMDWVILGKILDENLVLYIDDPLAGVSSRRFYKVVLNTKE